MGGESSTADFVEISEDIVGIVCLFSLVSAGVDLIIYIKLFITGLQCKFKGRQ